MNTLFLTIWFLGICIFPNLEAKQKNCSDMVVATKQIKLKEFSCIWNPSLIKTKEGFLLTFRYCLAPARPWISYVGCVMLDDDLRVISKPQLLNTREPGDSIPSQAEDARVFVSNGVAYLLYNDNTEIENPSSEQRRDMFIAKILYHNGRFSIAKPVKLYHQEKYHHARVQKNWVPFDWKGNILLAYSINPHEILYPNLVTGECSSVCEVPFKNHWRWGDWRGGTPALLVDGEYLAFFHSSTVHSSDASKGVMMYHYYMGAYTFSSEPPFALTGCTTSPIVGEGFYTRSSYDKRVIFPGGFAVVGSSIYVAYGKDDDELWIAIIDKTKLKRSLHQINEL